MASEPLGKASADADNPTPFLALDQLRPHLSMLMGRGGYQALLARALVLATAEVAWLKAVQVVTDGELQGVMVAQAGSEAADVSEGEVVLLAQLLGLLVAFIGPALTLRLITQIWPQLSLDDADFSKTASGRPRLVGLGPDVVGLPPIADVFNRSAAGFEAQRPLLKLWTAPRPQERRLRHVTPARLVRQQRLDHRPLKIRQIKARHLNLHPAKVESATPRFGNPIYGSVT